MELDRMETPINGTRTYSRKVLATLYAVFRADPAPTFNGSVRVARHALADDLEGMLNPGELHMITRCIKLYFKYSVRRRSLRAGRTNRSSPRMTFSDLKLLSAPSRPRAIV